MGANLKVQVSKEPHERIIVALDVGNPAEAISFVDLLEPHVGCFKLGLEFMMGTLTQLISLEDLPAAIFALENLRQLFQSLRGKFFWDWKGNDIPNTIAKAMKGLAPLQGRMINVHASAGIEAMRQANANKGGALLLAVTVLTSLEENNAHLIFGAPTKAKVLQFARDALVAGADGIICSPQELEFLGKQGEFTDRLLKVVPGVRPVWADPGDQKRVMTPGEAIKAGADMLVIGRPITKPPKEVGTPVDAVKRIIEEIREALAA